MLISAQFELVPHHLRFKRNLWNLPLNLTLNGFRYSPSMAVVWRNSVAAKLTWDYIPTSWDAWNQSLHDMMLWSVWPKHRRRSPQKKLILHRIHSVRVCALKPEHSTDILLGHPRKSDDPQYVALARANDAAEDEGLVRLHRVSCTDRAMLEKHKSCVFAWTNGFYIWCVT